MVYVVVYIAKWIYSYFRPPPAIETTEEGAVAETRSTPPGEVAECKDGT